MQLQTRTERPYLLFHVIKAFENNALKLYLLDVSLN